MTINVLNGAPKAMNQSLAADEGGTITGTLIARDPESDPLTFRVFDGSGPGPVRLVLNERTGEFSFGPVSQPGRYSFKFIARDGSHDSNTATVTIDVKPGVQEPPPSQESTTTTTTASDPSATTTTTRRPQAGRSSGGSSRPR